MPAKSKFVPVDKSPLHVTDDQPKVALEHCGSYTAAIADYLDACTSMPCGRGKTPVLPQYVANINADGKARFRSWQGLILDYDDAKRDPDAMEGSR
jgi:hypothetical protein